MFTQKKFLAALLLAPLFAACTVEDGDDDGAGTDTDPTATATVTDTDPTATMTDPTATMTDPTATVTDTDPTATVTDTDPTATVTDTDPTADTTDTDPTGDTTDSGGGGLFCQLTCVEDADCCQPDTEEMCPGDYPYNVSCSEAGVCEYGGCTSDDDCAIIAGTVCRELSGFPACVPLCEVDDDCLVDFGETCTGMTDDGEAYCTAFAPCESDKDCGGFGLCDVESGACGSCAVTEDCTKGYECVEL